ARLVASLGERRVEVGAMLGRDGVGVAAVEGYYRLELLDGRDAERVVEVGVGRGRGDADGQRPAPDIERRDAEVVCQLRRSGGEAGAERLDLGDLGCLHGRRRYTAGDGRLPRVG